MNRLLLPATGRTNFSDADASTTYLEKLTAEMSLLNAQLTLVNDEYSKLQAVVDLYAALGGGRN